MRVNSNADFFLYPIVEHTPILKPKNHLIPSVVACFLAGLCSCLTAAESVLWQQFKAAKLSGSEPTLPDFSFAGYDYSESPLPDTSGWQVFNVTNYGAIADDAGYDDSAIQATIDAAELAGGGIVLFPPGQFIVSSNNDITDIISVNGSNILLKGSGSGAGGTEIFMDEMKVNNGRYMFEVKPTSTGESVITTVVADADRETFEIEVADASGLSVGQRIILRTASVPFATNYYAPLALDPAWTRLASTSGFNLGELHTIEAITGTTVRFREPLHIPLFTSGSTIEVRSYNVITDVGVEDIRFTGNWASYPETFIHHKDDIHDYAWNALRFDNVANGWLKNCEFKDWNQGVYFDGCAAFTVDGIQFSGKKGHMSIHTRRSYGILIKDSSDTAGHYHGPGLGYWGCGTVYLRYQMAGEQQIDSHSGSPYANLMDGITGGQFSGNGGPYENYPHHGRHFVAWNFEVSGGPNSYNFWPSSRNSNTFAEPIFVGLQGKSISMSGEGANETPGQAVEPVSLFEAQLQFRLAPTTLTTAASEIGTDSATLNGELVSPGGSAATVRVYWGTTDGETDIASWDDFEDLGPSVVGSLAATIGSLVPGQTYYYRVWASNSSYDSWANESANFTIPGPPSVSVSGASQLASDQSTLNGSLGGGNPADITFVWDTVDNGTVSVNDWPASQGVVLADQADGPISAVATGLVPGVDYFYRIHATNTLGQAWSDSATFRVILNPVVTALDFDFNGDTVGNLPAGWNDSFSSTVASLTVTTDTNDWFGQGTSNQIARYTETNSGDNGLVYTAFTPTDNSDFFTITFDYYTPTNVSASGRGTTALGNDDLNNSARRNAQYGGPDLIDSLTTVSMLVNESGSTKSFFNPITGTNQDLLDGNYISFAYNHSSGGIAVDGSGTGALSYGSVDKFGFKTGSADINNFYFDDVVLHDNVLMVAVPEPGNVTYDDYISDPAFGLDPADRGFDLDPDGDNIANGVEAWFGTHPGAFNEGLTGLTTTSATSITFSHPHNENPPSGLSGFYEWSPNLADWYAGNGVDGPGGGSVVTFSTVNDGTSTTVTGSASESLGRWFVRLMVTQP